MGWFEKKEEVPDIAPSSILPELPKREGEVVKQNLPELRKKEVETEQKDLPELPSFPNNPINNNLNQEMVKSAVTDNLSPGEEEVIVEAPKDFHITEEVPGGSIPPIPSVASPISKLPQIPPAPQKRTLELNAIKEDKPITKSVEPIYIRIDKFQSAQKNFEQIKDKINEIESLLQKVKNVKSQEETELNGWTEDIEKIKARLAEVDSEIFNQL